MWRLSLIPSPSGLLKVANRTVPVQEMMNHFCAESAAYEKRTVSIDTMYSSCKRFFTKL
jgi:hypothetical protein